MNYFMKVGFIVIAFFCALFVYTAVKTNYVNKTLKPHIIYFQKSTDQSVLSDTTTNVPIKYSLPNNKTYNILMWTDDKTVPFVYLKKGNEVFKEDKCEYSNCYITKDKSYLPDITEFDALIFHAPEFTYTPWKRFYKPEKRSPHQRYVFTCIESAHNYPVCNNQYDNFFNWTWTYRTTSEVKWGYVDIKDMQGTLIGPKAGIEWVQSMKNVDEQTLDILRNKTKAAAWIVSNCYSKSSRQKYAEELASHLKQYNLSLDIYGKCGKLQCKSIEECHALIKKDYHFYLSFENSIAEDYVTEKFLHALKNYAVPIVLGGADYNRFAPPNTYLNANELNPPDMAERINSLIQNKSEYASYFKWRNYYKYQRDIETSDTRSHCRFCKALNEYEGKNLGNNEKYADFKAWWNAGIPKKC